MHKKISPVTVFIYEKNILRSRKRDFCTSEKHDIYFATDGGEYGGIIRRIKGHGERDRKKSSWGEESREVVGGGGVI